MLLITNNCLSQTAESSPYSRYGIGNLQSTGFNINNAIGGLAYGINESSNINFANPASYGFFKERSFTFETGIENTALTLSTTDTSQTNYNTSMGFLAFGFPVPKWWGSSFGIRPFTKAAYTTGETVNSTNTGSVNYTYEGAGGINQFYWGNGFQFNGLAIGINTSYLFGPLEKNRRQIFDQTNTLNYYNNELINLGGFYFNYGMQYSHTMDSLFKKQLSKPITLTLGGVVDFNTSLKARKKEIGITFIEYIEDPFLILPLDTVLSTHDTNSIVFPKSIGVGITLKRGNQLLIGLDYEQRIWSEYLSFGEKDPSITDSKRYAFGIQYTPNSKANNYLATVHYRAGLNYQNSNLIINGLQLDQYGTTFGVGLPLKRLKSVLHLSVEWGERGTTEKGLLKESYWKTRFGITLNDLWFVKRKYD